MIDSLSFKEALQQNKIQWKKHALERMLQRGISRKRVKDTLLYGEIIEHYDDDFPFPSGLFFYKNIEVIHVVASFDDVSKTIYIITAYIPNDRYFENNFKTRRKNDS